MRLTPDKRSLIREAIDRGIKKSLVAKVLGVSRQTVHKWAKRTKHLKDRARNKARKITEKVELFILGIRNTFDWGTHRIQQALRNNLPKFMEDKLRELHIKRPNKVRLSRTAINNVLKKHGINGYKKEYKSWKFFRAKAPNKLWQLDPKGPFTVQGKKYYLVVCIDDYSRYMLLAEQLDHDPSVEEIITMLKPLIKKHKPSSILTDNKPFRESWDEWCESNNIEPLHAHPYYPQDKGKIERTIRNVCEEFVNLLKKFPEWLDGKVVEYKEWFNNKRFSLGINAIPCELYV